MIEIPECIKNMLQEEEIQPSQCQDRIIFMPMYNEWLFVGFGEDKRNQSLINKLYGARSGEYQARIRSERALCVQVLIPFSSAETLMKTIVNQLRFYRAVLTWYLGRCREGDTVYQGQNLPGAKLQICHLRAHPRCRDFNVIWTIRH